MPSLQRLKETFPERRFEILAISVDEDQESVGRFLQLVPISLPVLWDPHGHTASAYQTYRLPESFLVGPDGVILKKYSGPRDWVEPEIRSEIGKYLRE